MVEFSELEKQVLKAEKDAFEDKILIEIKSLRQEKAKLLEESKKLDAKYKLLKMDAVKYFDTYHINTISFSCKDMSWNNCSIASGFSVTGTLQ